MESTIKNRLFLIFTIGFCFIVFNSISFAGDSDSIQQKKQTGLQNQETANKQKYTYRYYPSCNVYFDIHRKLYYYFENDNWKILSSLPSNLAMNLGDYVRIEMENDKPYTDNDKHVEKYTPEVSRKRKKNLLSKLIFVLLYEHSSR